MSQHPALYPNTGAIPLVVQLYHGYGYHPTVRVVLEDIGLEFADFEDQTSAIGVHPGPDYDSYVFGSVHPTVTFRAGVEGGDFLVLGAGAYADLRQLNNWQGRIASVEFNYGNETRNKFAAGIYGFGGQQIAELKNPYDIKAAPFGSIPLVLDAFTAGKRPGSDLVTGEEWWRQITLVDSNMNLGATYGNTFHGKIESVRVRRGSGYSGYDVVRLFRGVEYGGRRDGGYVEFGPTYDYGPPPPKDGGIQKVYPPGNLPVRSIEFTRAPVHPHIQYGGPFPPL